MSSRKYRNYHSRLERMAHIVVDGVVRITDAINSKEFSRTGIKNSVRALRKGRLVGKVGRPAAAVGEKEQRMENVFNDNDDEDAPFTEVSMLTAYGLVKRHQELRTGALKNLDINRLAVSCRTVLKHWFKALADLYEKFHCNPALVVNVDKFSTRVPIDSKKIVVHSNDAKEDFSSETPRMINSSFVIVVATDGYAFPFIILWPIVNLPEDLKSLLSPTLEILANKNGWKDNECF
ncbi:uncharacterized protein MONOS_4500 [Monocercomonoides exilis]|uniref:uncharacterized protein n=1 Tax=Monocercomonoides exilis TaxID=2049356 RepID=UPI0035599724|nr:hypothetical protein MONOS_4500 [Monocercomonoides exilis]|eukprot:MONOS_4500.1-p1 / transcript=MONOS_4500.1 / gene=MONOS_4500 / organism=Monocercomonoides_exilis_PA203 / gene_product=unspecified product / transcript_product=unspecified product / location=Mono_scaffold00120:70342-71158(+) / protein_length=235 / sequence_SO=supercontig / SO=protein_coding / is_pseudo=false